MKEGLYMKQAEVHGMSQRGGDVQSNLRISDQPIASDLIPSGKCDLIISLEPMEGLRYLPYLSPTGWLVTNETPFVNIPNYPETDKVMAEINKLPHKIVLNVDKVAKEVGSARVATLSYWEQQSHSWALITKKCKTASVKSSSVREKQL